MNGFEDIIGVIIISIGMFILGWSFRDWKEKGCPRRGQPDRSRSPGESPARAEMPGNT